MSQEAKIQFYDLAEWRKHKQRDQSDQPRTDRMLDVHEVADRIGSSKSTIYRMIERGEFPKGKHFGKRNRRWSESTIDTWQKEQKENM